MNTLNKLLINHTNHIQEDIICIFFIIRKYLEDIQLNINLQITHICLYIEYINYFILQNIMYIKANIFYKYFRLKENNNQDIL